MGNNILLEKQEIKKYREMIESCPSCNHINDFNDPSIFIDKGIVIACAKCGMRYRVTPRIKIDLEYDVESYVGTVRSQCKYSQESNESLKNDQT